MAGLGDDHPVGHPDDADRLAQDDLDLARVALPALREGCRLGTRLDRPQVDDRALGLGDDLLGDHDHVVILMRVMAVQLPARILRQNRQREQESGGQGEKQKLGLGGHFETGSTRM